MNLICPQCNQSIDENDFNVGTDIAYCRQCDATFSVATLVAIETVEDSTFQDFKRTCCDELGHGKTATVPFHIINRLIGVTILFCFLVMPFFFILLMNDKTFDEVWPLIAIGLAMIVPDLLFILFFCGGKYVVKIEHGRLRIQTGIFPVRRGKRIDLERTTSIYMEKNQYFQVNGRLLDQIVVETESRRIAFGVLLSKTNKACLMKWIAMHAS